MKNNFGVSGSPARRGAFWATFISCFALACAPSAFTTGADSVTEDEARRDFDSAGKSAPETGKARQESVPAEVPHAPVRVEHEGTGLGTKIRLVAYTQASLDRSAVKRAFDSALAEMWRLEALLSGYRDDSDVGRINASPGKTVDVSAETSFVIDRALWSAELSDGAFDITFQSLGHLWKFGDARESVPRLPDPETVSRALAFVDYRKVELDREEHRVRIAPHQKIGLGGIAKGYIVDEMARVLREAGLSAFMVQAGGDLFAAGTKPKNVPWETGIQDPRAPMGVSFAKLQLENHAFSTAGDYARAYFVENKRYHHIIDPKTGYPARASRSVTVWAKTAIVADALDDAIFIMGPEEGLRLVESIDGVGAVIVDGQNRLWVSRRLRDRLRISRLPSDGP